MAAGGAVGFAAVANHHAVIHIAAAVRPPKLHSCCFRRASSQRPRPSTSSSSTTASSFLGGQKQLVHFLGQCRRGGRGWGAGKRSSWSEIIFPRAMGSSASSPQTPDSGFQATSKSDYASLSDEEWKSRLTKEQYYITRQKGTERAFTGEYWNTKTPGTYHCVCCDTPLFEWKTKFDSGTGWPSYYEPIENNVKSKLDLSVIFMPRQEVLCAVCDAHLGHVFDDGPPPTGKRYCINSASLKLKPHSSS